MHITNFATEHCNSWGNPGAIRLFVFDCGKISGIGSTEFGFRDGELPSDMFTPCFLVEHPHGSLMWETGEIPDAVLNDNGTPTTDRAYTVSRPLLPQLASLGYGPTDITYLAMSHFHNDHVANANAFKGCTWLVQRAEHEAMFAAQPNTRRNGPILPNRAFYGDLESGPTVIIENQDHDVFGDGTVVLKYTPGHTPGHQSLFLRLEDTGPVLLTGDLYHYPEELYRDADFVNHASNAQTTLSRKAIEEFAVAQGARIWIQHDMRQDAFRRRAPECYS